MRENTRKALVFDEFLSEVVEVVLAQNELRSILFGLLCDQRLVLVVFGRVVHGADTLRLELLAEPALEASDYVLENDRLEDVLGARNWLLA